jgi:hypothetical protein
MQNNENEGQRIEMLLNEMQSEGSVPQIEEDGGSPNRNAPHQQSIQDYFGQREGATTDMLIEEFMVYFQYLIRQERVSLKEERNKLNTDKIEFTKDKK